MRSLFASRRQSSGVSCELTNVSEVENSADLPLPPAPPQEQDLNASIKRSPFELTNMEEFASKLEDTCR